MIGPGGIFRVEKTLEAAGTKLFESRPVRRVAYSLWRWRRQTLEVASTVIETCDTDRKPQRIAPQKIDISIPIEVLHGEEFWFAGLGSKLENREFAAVTQNDGQAFL